MKSNKIVIKELSPTDVGKNYLKWMNNKEILKFLESGKTKIKKKDLQRYVLVKKNSINEFLFGIYFRKSHIGNIKLGPINFKKKIGNIGYIIGIKRFQNKGFASEAINKILNYSFKKQKLKKVIANSEEKNLASIKVLEKNGFKKTRSRMIKRKYGKKKLVYFSVDKKTWLMK